MLVGSHVCTEAHVWPDAVSAACHVIFEHQASMVGQTFIGARGPHHATFSMFLVLQGSC